MMRMLLNVRRHTLAVALLALTACGERGDGKDEQVAAATAAAAPVVAEPAAPAPAGGERKAFFGAVHVHTSLSFDAFTNGTRTTPEDAYRWARGEEMTSSGHGAAIRNQTPLDFYMVSDHAEMLGVFRQMANPDSAVSKLPIAGRVLSPDPNTAMQAFAEILRSYSAGAGDPALSDPMISRSSWSDMIAAADRFYEPGTFTTFAGFEWSANPMKRNLHRVVVFRDTRVLPERPLSSNENGDDPESLWRWMEDQRSRGSSLLAIPHNGNASDGRMFELTRFDGSPIDAAYAETRAKNEPIYEISQIKGTSETHPDLSPTDEFAGFEQWDYTLSADGERPTHRKGSFARQALLDGMAFAASGMANPFKYGFIGDSDTHNAAASNEEFNYSGKFAHENIPEFRRDGAKGMPAHQLQQVREFSTGGLAGVWAEENTREAIFDAMLRKEVFATSGPLLRVRLFAGFGLGKEDLAASDWAARGYAKGVPMGGDLAAAPAGQAPTLLVMATKDPKSAHLDRIQIVKGWIDAAGQQRERIFDVAWSGERAPGADGRLPPVDSTVDLAKASYDNSIGAAELSAAWTDPEFDASQRAFYYARVLEIPTPRWSTYDAVKLGKPQLEGIATTIQERAWSSPVWYTPG
jgi:hypothetical protein